MEFGEKLKAERLKLGLTQAEFAKLAGFSRSNISELENGSRKSSLKTIKKIVKATNTRLSEWITEDTEFKVFDGLEVVIDALFDVGEIDAKGGCSKEADMLLLKMLHKEIEKYIEHKKKN